MISSSIDSSAFADDRTVVYLALGSNLGDRAANINKAIKLIISDVILLDSNSSNTTTHSSSSTTTTATTTSTTTETHSLEQLLTTSFLYETDPAYVRDQPAFLNACVRIRTRLSPQELLRRTQSIEGKLGRASLETRMRYGPREIDVDILFYGNQRVDQPDLTIPHKLMQERDFVLYPLMDIDPSFVHPIFNKTIAELWTDLGRPTLRRVLPVGPDRVLPLGNKTHIMGILNVTPDSFTGDGLATHQHGIHKSSSSSELVVQRAVEKALKLVDEGADIIDVGGFSTRPGAPYVSVEDELERSIPVVKALAAALPKHIPISIDTFRWEVAKEALASGASIINDVWGMRIDTSAMAQLVYDQMDCTVAPIVLTHNNTAPDYLAHFPNFLPFATVPTRTTAAAPAPPPPPAAEEENLLLLERLFPRLSAELHRYSIDMAKAKGIPRWMLIIDPGIGFGKTKMEHLYMTRYLDEFKRQMQQMDHEHNQLRTQPTPTPTKKELIADNDEYEPITEEPTTTTTTTGVTFHYREEYPLLYGASNKGFIGKLVGSDESPAPVQERSEGTLALNAIAMEHGADIVRVHDVKETARVAKVIDTMRGLKLLHKKLHACTRFFKSY